MKTFFSIVSLVVGIIALLLGVRIFHFIAQNPLNVAAGLVVLAVGATCVWLARQTVSDGDMRLL